MIELNQWVDNWGLKSRQDKQKKKQTPKDKHNKHPGGNSAEDGHGHQDFQDVQPQPLEKPDGRVEADRLRGAPPTIALLGLVPPTMAPRGTTKP